MISRIGFTMLAGLLFFGCSESELDGSREAGCAADARRCDGRKVQRCDESGAWVFYRDCEVDGMFCELGGCVGEDGDTEADEISEGDEGEGDGESGEEDGEVDMNEISDDDDEDDGPEEENAGCSGPCTWGTTQPDLPYCMADGVNVCYCHHDDESGEDYWILKNCDDYCVEKEHLWGVCGIGVTDGLSQCRCYDVPARDCKHNFGEVGGMACDPSKPFCLGFEYGDGWGVQGTFCGECVTEEQCPDYCIEEPLESGFPTTSCYRSCHLASCDRSTYCIDIAPYIGESEPFGICYDYDNAPTGCSPEMDFCGDQNHWCTPEDMWEDSQSRCFEMCTPAEDECPGHTICLPNPYHGPSALCREY